MRELQTERPSKCLIVMLTLLLLCILILPAWSQQTDNPRIKIVSKEAQQFESQSAYLNHKNNYIDKAESMNIVPVTANNWYTSKINIAKHQEFERIGIDLQKMASMTNHITDYEYHTLFSDVIVKGKVTSKVYEKSRRSYWHTMYTVQVTEVLKGNSSLDSVKIYQLSGYIEDMPVRLSLDKTLSVGDEGIIHLNYWTSDAIKELQEELSAGYGLNGATDANITDDGRSFGMTLFQPIKNGYIYTEGNKEGRTNDVTSRIKNILEVNNSEEFYRIDFKNEIR